MPILDTQLNTRSADFQANAAAMRALVDDLNTQIEKAALGEANRPVPHTARGKLLPASACTTCWTPALLSWKLHLGGHGHLQKTRRQRRSAQRRVVAGIGRVNGVDCMIVCDATVKGGSYFPLTVKKHLRAQEIAAQNRLTCIYLVDSGGANLPTQDEVFPDREHFGRIFYNQANMSAQGIAQIAVVMGSCTAGGAYVPAMSDETIIVRTRAPSSWADRLW